MWSFIFEGLIGIGVFSRGEFFFGFLVGVVRVVMLGRVKWKSGNCF